MFSRSIHQHIAPQRATALLLARTNAPRSIRFYSPTPSHHASTSKHSAGRLLAVTSISLVLVSTTILLNPKLANDEAPDGISRPERKKSLTSLLRSYFVYSLCAIPPVVDSAPTIISALESIPGIRQITEAIIRATFFAQFVGGDTVEDTLPVIKELQSRNQGVILAYSVEVDEETATSKQASRGKAVISHKSNVEEMVHSIDMAGDFADEYERQGGKSRNVWVAVKLSALLPHAQTLTNFSEYLTSTRPQDRLVHYPGTPHSSDMDILQSKTLPKDSNLTEEDLQDLQELQKDLLRICSRAKQRNVKIIVDAEYTWYQPATEAYQLYLMKQFNKNQKTGWSLFKSDKVAQPLIYGTFQAYLRRNAMHILRSIEIGKAEGFAVGIKLVRGAYHSQEMKSNSPYEPDVAAINRSMAKLSGGFPSHLSKPTPPVWSKKEDTDASYNATAGVLLDFVNQSRPPIGVLFGTHNKESCDLIVSQLIARRLARATGFHADGKPAKVQISESVARYVGFGQLYGMSDVLTDTLADTLQSPSPMLFKYVPYGALVDVIPYLGRRAIENKSVLGASEGGAVDERRRAGAEIRRRLFG